MPVRGVAVPFEVDSGQLETSGGEPPGHLEHPLLDAQLAGVGRHPVGQVGGKGPHRQGEEHHHLDDPGPELAVAARQRPAKGLRTEWLAIQSDRVARHGVEQGLDQ